MDEKIHPKKNIILYYNNMSFIDIEYDQLLLSSSPIYSINYFPIKFYRLYQSNNNNESIIINGSFLFNQTNELYSSNSPTSKLAHASFLPDNKRSKIDNFNDSVSKKLGDETHLGPYYKNIDKLFIHTKEINFYINTNNLEIENTNKNIDKIVYQSNIKNKKNIKYREFIIMLSSPILINISYDNVSDSNCVSISSINDNGCGGSSYSYCFSNSFNSELDNINSINLITKTSLLE